MTTSTTEAQRLERLFDELIALPPTDRPARLRAIEAEDKALAKSARELLDAWNSAPGFLDCPAIESDLAGHAAGPWILEERVAFGGTGQVYRGRRDGGAIDWRVAVKVLKRCGPPAELERRFERERRMLAQLNHPYIVPLVDVGILPDERPFLVTKLIDGVTLDRHVVGLALIPRLRLFVSICSAVSHAHERLVVHCDLKPANILITREGIPQLLDFGIARLQDDPTSGVAALTPGYASPEQLRGDVLSTATDVFSLGVVLYELATNERPFKGETDREFVAPSNAVVDPIDPKALRGDFDAIVAKALRLDPDRRYPSVAELAADVQRFCDKEPITARPPSTLRRVALLVRKNPVAASACAMALMCLAIGGVGLYRGLVASREEARTGWRAHAQAAMAARWIEDLARSSGSEVALVAALDAAAQRLEGAKDIGAETEGRMRMTLGALYLNVRRVDDARRHLLRARSIAATTRGFGTEDRARIAELMQRCDLNVGARGPSSK